MRNEKITPLYERLSRDDQLKPIAMAEFWWGDSPKAEIRHIFLAF